MPTNDLMIRKARAAGVAVAVAFFVSVGLFVTTAAEREPAEHGVASAALPEDVTAPADRLSRAFAAVAARIKPAVVSVYSEHMITVRRPAFPFPFGDEFFGPFFGPQFAPPRPQGEPREYKIPQRGLGSGMILDKEGRILTNYHVVKDVEKIKVQLADKRTFPAVVVGTDPKTDVAVIRIKGQVPSDLPVARLGDSDALEDGNLVLAVGAPFGLTQTVTNGIISAKGRSDVGIAAYEDFLQTDAPINPGNSGGPLVNMRGEVIGMNSAIATGGPLPGGEGQFGGVGFAIPINMIKSMLPALLAGGQVTRGTLGVGTQDINEDLARQFSLPGTDGALVSQVKRDSPGEKAGVQPGDVIVGFAGKAIHDTRQLRNVVASTAPGTSVRLDIIRSGERKSLTVAVGRLSGEASGAKPSGAAADQLARLGLSVQTLTPDLARQYDLQTETGAVITGVQEGSPAAMAGLQTGDLIIEADHNPVRNAVDLQRALAKGQEQLLLLVQRKGTTVFVVFRLR